MFGLLKKKQNPKELPNCWKEYLSYFQTKPDYKRLITEGNFVVLDVESNGLDPKRDKILSIGVIKIFNNQIDTSNSLELFLNQSEYNPEAAPIHGIMRNGKLEKVTEQEAMKKLIEFIKDDVIVGHSIIFDISIINETLKKYVNDKILNKTLDTVSLYIRLKGADFKVGTSTSLDALSDEFKIPKSDRHNAAGDAFITAILFLKLISRLKQRGVLTIEDLLKSKRTLI